jgi:acyl carrier protein
MDEPIEMILAAVRRAVGRPIQALDADMPLISTGIVDSFAIATLAEELTDAFGRTVSIESLGVDNADTARQIARLVASEA